MVVGGVGFRLVFVFWFDFFFSFVDFMFEFWSEN